MGKKRESQQRIRDLEEYIKALERREVEGNAELERYILEMTAEQTLLSYLLPKTWFCPQGKGEGEKNVWSDET